MSTSQHFPTNPRSNLPVHQSVVDPWFCLTRDKYIDVMDVTFIEVDEVKHHDGEISNVIRYSLASCGAYTQVTLYPSMEEARNTFNRFLLCRTNYLRDVKEAKTQEDAIIILDELVNHLKEIAGTAIQVNKETPTDWRTTFISIYRKAQQFLIQYGP